MSVVFTPRYPGWAVSQFGVDLDVAGRYRAFAVGEEADPPILLRDPERLARAGPAKPERPPFHSATRADRARRASSLMISSTARSRA